MMNSKWRLPHPATMFLLLTLAVIVLSWIFDIYGLSVFQPQTGEEIRVQSLLSPEGVRWLLRHVVTNFTGLLRWACELWLCLVSGWHNIQVL